MGLIWQEFRGIVADVWGVVASWGAWLLKGFRELLKGAAENYQRVIVVGIGMTVSFFLVGVPLLAMLESVGSWIKTIFGEPPTRRIFTGSFIGFLLMFCLGIGAFTLTVELDDRIMKRLEGKPKDAAASTESEAS